MKPGGPYPSDGVPPDMLNPETAGPSSRLAVPVTAPTRPTTYVQNLDVDVVDPQLTNPLVGRETHMPSLPTQFSLAAQLSSDGRAFHASAVAL